ncbi:MAG: cytochrome c oxidase assembly protein [Caldilineaceae bacterium]|nr:cytochrome c oxidase assembly protein [Caldilineaceae bacterium]
MSYDFAELLRNWSWQPVAVIGLLLVAGLYGRGWLRMRRALPGFASGRRLGFFVLAIFLLILAAFSPLYALSGRFLLARSFQKVFVAMLAAPLLWQACPFHVMAWGLPGAMRRRLTRLVLRPSGAQRVLRLLTQPMVALLVFISAFLLWHDPEIANRTLGHEWAHRATLWLLLGAALLFWWHVVDTGPRLHRLRSSWLIAASLILVEIPNMASGVTIAFTDHPIYAHYAAMQAGSAASARLDVMTDQMVSGALIWVMGSLVYMGSLVIVVRRLFVREGSDEPDFSFGHDIADRAMAPGLEDRNALHPWE